MSTKARFGAMRTASGAAMLAIALALSACSAMGDGYNASVSDVSQTRPISQGQKIVMATHSFNVFVGPTSVNARDPNSKDTPGPLAALAAERGKAGHETLMVDIGGTKRNAVQMIGGSTPMQHWSQGDGDDSKNIAKQALLQNGDKVSVFTMSPNAIMPEQGIDNFGDFVIAHNKNARIMVQNSWGSYDGHGTTAAVGGTGAPDFKNEQRDLVPEATVDGWITALHAKGGYLERLRTQLDGIDKRAGKQITYVVPSGDAVYQLRKQVIQGKVPGVAKQSELTRDGIGHPTTVQSHLVTYVWYAAMYRESPVGLKALVDAADANSARRETMLQQIAWNAVVGEPKSGVKGKTVKVGA